MKRDIKSMFLFLGLILSFFVMYPTKAYALSKQTSYVPIHTTQNLEVGSLTFLALSFNDYSSISTQAFGLTGIVYNLSTYSINYTSQVFYYDENYNLVAQGSFSGTAESGGRDFNQMSNLSILGEHTIDEIYFYRFVIQTTNADYSSSLIPSKNYQYRSFDYVLYKYDVNILVHENNTFDITETITAYFRVPKHGIFRSIPLKNTITRLDGTTSKNRTQVTNVSVDHEYTTAKENGNYKLQIGSPIRTLTGEQTYRITYTYNLGKDSGKNYDELYYNIIGNEWDTVIGNVTFTITMPKEFDSSKLGFSSGVKGSTDNQVNYAVHGNTITGSYNGILDVGEALTVRCELPEGYFVDAGLTRSPLDYLMFVVPIVLLVISVLLWYVFGRDNPVVETVEFYPPAGLNSLDVGFLYKGEAENKDVTSLLIYLANKGYIQILNDERDFYANKVHLSESSKNKASQKIMELQNKITEEKQNNPNSRKIKVYENMLDIYRNIDTPIDYKQYSFLSSLKKMTSKNTFVIKKVKDYDGDNLHEEWFMEGLFEFGRTEVTEQMLYNEFYITNNQILRDINRKQNKYKLFEKRASNKKWVIIFMMLVTYCFITMSPLLAYGDLSTLVIALLFPGIGFSVLVSMVFGKGPMIRKIFGFVWGSFFGGMPWCLVVLPVLLQDSAYFIGYIVGLVCLVGMFMCLKYMPKRTLYGTEMLGKLKGFKTFLETAEKDKLEAMVLQNPTYFYDILPYTYVLGVSDKWIKKFETISLQAPSWYDSTTAFDVTSFASFMNTTMASARSAMSSSPVHSSGSSSGGSSGGGSSGGGSGGGGGGSW